MTNRYMPSEEYRRKLRYRHVLEGFCLINAAVILILALIFGLDINRELWLPETIAVLGGIMNFMLAIRGILVRSWMQTAGLLAASCVCFALFAYVKWT